MRAFILLAAFLLALASPANAGDDVAAAQSVIRSQTEAFSHDDAASAYSFAAPAIHDMFPQADIFMYMVQHSYAPVYRHRSFEFGEGRAADGKIAQRVHIVDENGEAWEALYTLEQQPDGSGGCVGDRIGAAEAGRGRLRGRRAADEQCGPACPALADLASARGPRGQCGGGQSRGDQSRGRRWMPGCRHDQTAPGQVQGCRGE